MPVGCLVNRQGTDALSPEERIKYESILAAEEQAAAALSRPDEILTLKDAIRSPMKFMKQVKSGKPVGSNYFSPSFYLEMFPDGKRLIQITDKAVRERFKWLKESSDRVYGTRKNILAKRIGGIDELGIKAGTADAESVGILLENPEAIGEFSANVRRAATIIRSEFERLFGEIQALTPEERIGRIKNYLPRIFDKEILETELRAEIEFLKANPSPTSAMQISRLENTLANINKVPLTYEQLPSKLRVQFFETRTGRGGYSLDAVKAYNSYVAATSRKVFMEPILREAVPIIQSLPRQFRPLAIQYARRATGTGSTLTDALPSILGSIREFQFFRTIGFNPATAVKNLTQQLFTSAEVGVGHMAKAWRLNFDPRALELFDVSGHALDVPTIFLGQRHSFLPKWQRAVEISGWMFNRVETANRRIAYLAGMDKWFADNSKKIGMTFEQALQRGIHTIPEEALTFADDIVRKTQFRYGTVDLPLFLDEPLTGTALQFSSFAIKSSELMWKWAYREGNAGRLKLVSLLAAAGAFETIGGLAGFPTLGDGTASPLSVPEMFEFLASVTEGDWVKARSAALNVANFDPLTIGFGPAVSTIQEFSGVLGRVQEGVPFSEAAKRFGLNEILPVSARRLLEASDQLEAGGGADAFVSQLVGIPTGESIVRKQAIRLIERGQPEMLKDLIRAYKEVRGGHLPPDFLNRRFVTKGIAEAKKESRKRRKELGKEKPGEKIIRRTFGQTEKVLRNRFTRPIGSF